MFRLLSALYLASGAVNDDEREARTLRTRLTQAVRLLSEDGIGSIREELQYVHEGRVLYVNQIDKLKDEIKQVSKKIDDNCSDISRLREEFRDDTEYWVGFDLERALSIRKTILQFEETTHSGYALLQELRNLVSNIVYVTGRTSTKGLQFRLTQYGIP